MNEDKIMTLAGHKFIFRFSYRPKCRISVTRISFIIIFFILLFFTDAVGIGFETEHVIRAASSALWDLSACISSY